MKTFSQTINVVKRSLRLMKLDQFLKWSGLVSTGGEAKHLITEGHVMVNGSRETRRGRKLIVGDLVSFRGEQLMVQETVP